MGKGKAAPVTYANSGVDSRMEEAGLSEIGAWVNQTFALNRCKPLLPLGYFANVIELTPEQGLAISTDGVGTKLLIAQALGKYDTVGIDCVAMNANDVICVGARPISMVDYIAVQKIEPGFLGAIGKGLYAGAKAAGINVPGGEIAQVSEMIRDDVRPGYGFDLVGTCVGTVHPQRILIGQAITPGDVVVGIASSGIHSNGLTLARRVLFRESMAPLGEQVAELGQTLGEELLTPTHIYVREALAMLDAGLAIKALIHITSDGFLNLTRVASETGYVIDTMLEPQPIFALIKRRGAVSDPEMFHVYNMGTGFCVVVSRHDADRVVAIAKEHGRRAQVIGYAVHDPQKRVWIPAHKLIGQGEGFHPSDETPPPCPKAG
jgi:phosphoribosylformylglycinamidine cyclo-ligase